MKVFEFHFNPKMKTDIAFDSFCYEPENIYERKMGSLYMVGMLKNLLPQNTRFLENLVKAIKDKYYRSSIFTQEKALKESLKVANENLEKITKRGNVSWLGNLSFAVISLSNFKLNFTKVGDIKVLLIRDKKIIDIDKKIRLQEMEPYPLKVFSNTVSGKLAEDDIILVLTEDMSNFLQEQKVIEKIASQEYFDEKILRDLLSEKKDLLAEKVGILLLVLLTKEIVPKQKQTISPEQLKDFSFKEVFTPLLSVFKKTKPKKIQKKIKPRIEKESSAIETIKKARKKPKTFLKTVLQSIKLPSMQIPESISDFLTEKIRRLFSNKKLISSLAFIMILIIGFSISKMERENKANIYSQQALEMEEKMNVIESLLALEQTNPEAVDRANDMLKDLWNKISPITNDITSLPQGLKTKILFLEERISDKLTELNKLEEIENPESFYILDPLSFVPNKLLYFDQNLYFYSPYQKNILLLKENKKTTIIETESPIVSAINTGDFTVFYSEPTELVVLKTSLLKKSSIETPYADFDFNSLASYKDHLYFLDKKTGQIIKYPYAGNLEWNSPELWLQSKSPKSINAQSITVDGSVWVLSQNKIIKYHGGQLEKEMDIEIFPEIKSFTKIQTLTLSPTIYILEPEQNRIVLINKQGAIIRQFRSEKWDNLLDFSVSDDEKSIYLLNGLEVFKITL